LFNVTLKKKIVAVTIKDGIALLKTANSKGVITGCNLAEYSKEGYGSKTTVSAATTTMMMMHVFCSHL
jgi:hypothetical protein